MFHFTINISTIAKIVSQMVNGFDEALDSIYGRMSSMIDAHQSMIEYSYISSLLTFKEYIEIGQIERATEALMELSNRIGTPVINYLLGNCLILLGHQELGRKKIIRALEMNPLLAFSCGIQDLTYLYSTSIPLSNWSCVPYQLEDDLKNKAQRAFGMQINEGISNVDICSMGGNIAFVLRVEDMNRSIYGLIDACDGKVIWKNVVEEEEVKSIVLNSIEYVVYKKDNMYYISSSMNGSILSVLSRNTFYSIFCPKSILDKKELSTYRGDARIIYSQEANWYVRSNFYEENQRTFVHTDGSKVHPSLVFDKYSVYNVQFQAVKSE